MKGTTMATRHYLGVVEPAAEGWSISFPAFPGAVSAGNTFAEVMANGRDALASVIEAMREDGDEVPESFDGELGKAGYNAAYYHDPRIVMISVEVGGKAARINVTMDEGLVALLDSAADRLHSNRSALLARGARMFLAAEAAV
jgi:predicted RNase H-like HicB family nuclease